jgi:FixJ family two-component response regulator
MDIVALLRTLPSGLGNLVLSGMLNKQIAAKLYASEATVKMHRSQGDEKDAD